MKTFKELLIELHACLDAREWAAGMTVEDVVAKCHRGDWLLWLAKQLDINCRKLTLAKAYCANTVRHLMKDERSIKAVDAAISYGNLEIIRADLNDVAYAAYAAAAAAAAADDAAYAADDAAYAAYAAGTAAAAAAAYAAADAAADAAAAAADADAYADAAAYADAYAARKSNQMQTADICREIIGKDIIDKVNQLLNTHK